jgi:hypothetical protein
LLPPSKTFTKSPEKKQFHNEKDSKEEKSSEGRKWQMLAYPLLSLLSGKQRFLPVYSPSSFFSVKLF